MEEPTATPLDAVSPQSQGNQDSGVDKWGRLPDRVAHLGAYNDPLSAANRSEEYLQTEEATYAAVEAIWLKSPGPWLCWTCGGAGWAGAGE